MSLQPVSYTHLINRASLRSVVEKLPEGMNTIVGSGGQGLSGGERQRVASVSYTHLDVYKRQDWYCSGIPFRYELGRIFSFYG